MSRFDSEQRESLAAGTATAAAIGKVIPEPAIAGLALKLHSVDWLRF